VDTEDNDLVRQAAGGDRDALVRLLKRHGSPVRQSLAGRIPSCWQAVLTADDVALRQHELEPVARRRGLPDGAEEAHADGARIRAANAGLVEPLTGRELEVLALLRERLSNKEIARRLCLSPVTVKRYAVCLYGKLGVNKRWDAVVKAEALGILPPR